MASLGFLVCFVLLIASANSFPVHQRLSLSRTKDAPFVTTKRGFLGREVFPNIETSSRGRLQAGVTFDFCETSEDCAGDRTCDLTEKSPFDKDVHFPCPDGNTDCFCFGDEVTFCSSHSDCEDPRETCAGLDAMKPFCVSMAVAAGKSFDILPPTPDDRERPENPASGKTLYPCATDADCKGDRTCDSQKKDDFIKNRERCSEKEGDIVGCLCQPPTVKKCSKNAQCEEGEVCVLLKFLTKHGSFCVSADMELHSNFESVSDDVPSQSPVPTPTSTSSLPEPSEAPEPSPVESVAAAPPVTMPSKEPSPEDLMEPSEAASIPGETLEPSETEAATPSSSDVTPSASPTEDPICIDARALNHLDRNDLVFEKHARANVLCDSYGSCATKGHMVVYKGSTMMMRTYCALTGCSEKEMEVNSPKYKRGMRVGSNTEGLDFTVFAARYATRAEEVVIKIAVRAGF